MKCFLFLLAALLVVAGRADEHDKGHAIGRKFLGF
jgi:hypothetical protein